MTDVENLNSLLKTSNFIIPQFQRNYSWEKEHVEDFWNDAWDSINEKNTNYYFGPIVLVKIKNSSDFKVVDGQQRITTLSILLSVIRDISKITENGEVFQFTGNYLYDDMKKEKTSRLTLNENNSQYYKDFILNDMDPELKIKMKPVNQYEKNLFNTYKTLFEKIKEKFLVDKKNIFKKENKELIFEINEFLKNVLFSFQIFKIILDNDDDASKLFATLNERGLSLSISDLIKNYIFSKSEAKNRDDHHKIWQIIIETLGENIKMDKYLQHHFIAWKSNVKEQNLYSAITGEVKNDKSVTEYLDSLKDKCKIYSDVMSSDTKQNPSTHLIELFLELQNDSAQPFLLNAIKKWGKKSNEVRDLSRICLDVHFRAKTIGGRSAKEIVDAFADAAELVRNPEGTAEISDIVSILKKIDFSDADFMANIRNKDFAPRNAKYFLKNIESKREKSKNKVKTVVPEITLEHIMPKNEDAKGWESMKMQHDELLNKIGNLTLLHSKPNSEERDNAFEIKQKKYAESGLIITEYLARKNDWNETEITSRGIDLASDAPAVWKSVKSYQE